MAAITDCIGKTVKISKNSITIKNEETGKTSGIIKNITSLKDIQCNKQIAYFKILKTAGLHGTFPQSDYIIGSEDSTMYLFRNIKSKLFHEKYGYISEEEKQKAEEKEKLYEAHKQAGIPVIECICV